MIRLNIIGAGKVGQTLAMLWKQNQSVTIASVCNRTITTAQNAVDFLGGGAVAPTLHDLQIAELYLISTTDDAITSTAESLALLEVIPMGAVVFHCSGFMSSDGLSVLKSRGCHVASVHPVKSFADIRQAMLTFEGTYCAFEGDAKARAMILPLFQAIGGIIFDIDKKNKAIYHAAGVFASNYLVTLAHAATNCYHLAQVPAQVGKALVIQLMRNTIDNIECSDTISKALTGPIQRGDVSTILGHIKAMSATELESLYRLMGKETMALVNHPSNITAVLQSILHKELS